MASSPCPPGTSGETAVHSSSLESQDRHSGHHGEYLGPLPDCGMTGKTESNLEEASQVAKENSRALQRLRQAGNRTREKRENMCAGKTGTIVLTFDGSLSVTDSTTGDLVAVDMAGNEF